MIELKNVSKTYRDIKALHGVNFKIESGEFVSILGPSGSGKTTLLNVIAGLLAPSNGKVIIDGVAVYELSLRERISFIRTKFGFIFQAFNLISYLTALENVEVPLYLAGVKKTKQVTIAKELLEKVGLQDRLRNLPPDLSIGEQQRVAVARALANNAPVILADEPTGNLDKKTGKGIMEYIKQLNKEGVTVLLVTHDPDMARFADRETKIIDGRLS